MLPEITQLWSVNKLWIMVDYSCAYLDHWNHQTFHNWRNRESDKLAQQVLKKKKLAAPYFTKCALPGG